MARFVAGMAVQDRIARADAIALRKRIDSELASLSMEQRDQLLQFMDEHEHAWNSLVINLLALVRKSQRIDSLDDHSIGLVFSLVGSALRREEPKAAGSGMG